MVLIFYLLDECHHNSFKYNKDPIKHLERTHDIDAEIKFFKEFIMTNESVELEPKLLKLMNDQSF